MKHRTSFFWAAAVWCGAVLSFPAPASGATNVWFSPDGGRSPGTRERPMAYDGSYIRNNLLGDRQQTRNKDREVILHFLPGNYVIQPINTLTYVASDWRITIRGEGRRPEDTVLTMVPNHPEGASETGGGWADVIDLGRNEEYLDRFVLENITIDGNWTGQSNVNHRAYLRGYKNSPVYVSSRTGRIRDVIVRNYGAHGLMPQRPGDLAAGVEVFPLRVVTRDEGQAPEDGDARPWVIENCEVTGFHGLYGGYSTTLMAVVAINPATIRPTDDPARRLVWFRGNQVRGNADGLGVIGMGAAGLSTNLTGRVTWSDNVILNGSGFNTDTGGLRWLDFTNCLMLDVAAVGYLGAPNASQPYHQNYQISGNSVRLVGHVTGRNYRTYRWGLDGNRRFGAQLDPSLVLGRPWPEPSSGLIIGGVANDIRFTDNWFTTRSHQQFNDRGRLVSREPGFRIVNRLPMVDPELPESPQLRRHDALDVNLEGNRMSSVPFDFTRMKPLRGERLAKLAEGSSPLLNRQSVLAAKGGFAGSGTVQRVVMIMTNTPGGSDRRLIGAIEVVCGEPSRSAAGRKFSVPVRVALQPTPMSGRGETRPLPRQPVNLEVLPGSRHPQKLTAITDNDGVATFTYDVAPDANGMDYFRAWADFGQGTREVWDEYQDAWATSQQAHGNTVGVVVEMDVADARNTGTPGRLRLVRTGSNAQPLRVKMGFGTGPFAAEAGRDFKLVMPSKKGRDDVLEFAAGERELTVEIEALPKTARSGKLVNLQIQSGENYAVGDPPAGDVVVYVPSP